MTTWKSKLFGDNRLNFYSWIVGGFGLIIFSAWVAWKGLQGDNPDASIVMLLASIYILLVGIFGIVLQNYCARVASAIEAADAANAGQSSTRGRDAEAA